MKSSLPGLLCLLVAQGCVNTPVNDKTAQLAYQELEHNLLSAAVLRVDYQLESHGIVNAKLYGDLVIQKPALAAISAKGVFSGADVTPVLVANGVTMRGGSAPAYFEQAAPLHLRDGILIGLMRMGILHNLANLSQGVPPEGTDGGVREWVVAQGFQWAEATRRSGDIDLRGIGFSLQVGGEPAGEVVMWYDPASGLPVEREQLVHFDNGDMQVSEYYRIETDGMIGPCRFDPDSVTITRDP